VSETGKAKIRRWEVDLPNNFNDQVPNDEGTEDSIGATMPLGRDGHGGTETNVGETPGIGEERKAAGDVKSKRGKDQ
jgi:hypothetical protein